ncbi:hypothetical protein KR038_011949, partial [Drosophila bunnanda]
LENDDNLMEGPTGSAGPSAAKPLEFGLHFADATAEDEDEWSDYTEENRFNYTSMPRNTWKTLSGTLLAPSTEIKVLEPEQREQCAGDGLDVGPGKRLEEGPGPAACPWQNMEKTHPQEQPKEPKEPKEGKFEQQQESKNPSENTQNPEMKPQVYIPPALRQTQSDTRQRPQVEKASRKLPSAISLGKPQAPDIKSSEYFPSLGGSKSIKRPK